MSECLTDLHSTMLLLYRILNDFLVDGLLNLHSTMLLLYPTLNPPFLLSTFHLHSTMLLLYQCNGETIKTYDSIYIPLCFYFIGFSAHAVNMVYFIYIPLCFYFIPIPTFSTKSASFIYIPLCFYFIWKIVDNLIIFSLFTFHYASTLSEAEIAGYTNEQNLHSTMLLLYRESPKIR